VNPGASPLRGAAAAHSSFVTPTRAGLLGLAAAGTTATALLTRLFIQALKDLDVEVPLDPYGQTSRRRALAVGPAVPAR
jgi:hypothetical protein